MPPPPNALLRDMSAALGLGAIPVTVTGAGSLPSTFAVTDLAVAAIAAAGSALAHLLATAHGTDVDVLVDRDLASAWFAASLRPAGWHIPPTWDPIAGDYPSMDGWIRLHTNAPRHRDAALTVLGLGTNTDRRAVARAVSRWTAENLETHIVGAGGAAAAMRSLADWGRHPQGFAVSNEPLVHRETTGSGAGYWRPRTGGQPLAGLRVLDLTRVVAGPVATRLLAGWGADVLRVDPPGWDEDALAPEVTLGKRCARLDLRGAEDRARWWSLLAEADVLVHGYRPGALDSLELGAEARAQRRPGLVEVSLSAYGWGGPWWQRRGFDSLVQMSSGIAHAGMAAAAGADRPVPLPVQALDHATGYLMAAAAIAGVTERERHGAGSRWRASLARTARLLTDSPRVADRDRSEPAAPAFPPEREQTAWGPAQRLPPPLHVRGAPLRWGIPARRLGSDPPAFRGT